MVQDPGQDIRAAAGAAGAVDQSIAKSTDDCAVKRIEKDIALQVIDQMGRQASWCEQGGLQDQVGKKRIRDDRKCSPHGKLAPAEKTPAQQEERNVAQKDQDTDR